VITVAALIPGQRATFEGRVSEVEDINKRRGTFRWILVGDDSGEVRVRFAPGRGGADIAPGQVLRVTGRARQSGSRPMWMVNPAYDVVEQPQETSDAGGEGEAGEIG
jgi:hypothetical protein